MSTEIVRDEHWLSNELKKSLRQHKWLYFQQYIANTQTGRGAPDFVIVANGLPLFVELKHPTRLTEKPRPEQVIVHKNIRKAGGYVLVSRSVGRVMDALNHVLQNDMDSIYEKFGTDGMKGLND